MAGIGVSEYSVLCSTTVNAGEWHVLLGEKSVLLLVGEQDVLWHELMPRDIHEEFVLLELLDALVILGLGARQRLSSYKFQCKEHGAL